MQGEVLFLPLASMANDMLPAQEAKGVPALISQL